MYCPKCGTKAAKKAEFCEECGASLTSEVAAPTTTVTEVKNGGSSFGWGVLGFFIPLVGLILFITWNKERKSDAKAAGIGALISTILYILFYIVIFVIFFAVGFSEGYNGVYY